MKEIASLIVLLAASILTAYAQDAQDTKGAKDTKGGKTQMELQAQPQTQSVLKPAEEKKTTLTQPKPTNEILGKRVVYGGLFTDFLRAEKKRPFFSLRTPIDPQKDLENLSLYPGTDKVQGVVLFSVKF